MTNQMLANFSKIEGHIFWDHELGGKMNLYTQSPLIRTTAKLPTLDVLKNSSNLDAHWFLIPQVWALAGS